MNTSALAVITFLAFLPPLAAQEDAPDKASSDGLVWKVKGEKNTV